MAHLHFRNAGFHRCPHQRSIPWHANCSNARTQAAGWERPGPLSPCGAPEPAARTHSQPLSRRAAHRHTQRSVSVQIAAPNKAEGLQTGPAPESAAPPPPLAPSPSSAPAPPSQSQPVSSLRSNDSAPPPPPPDDAIVLTPPDAESEQPTEAGILPEQASNLSAESSSSPPDARQSKVPAKGKPSKATSARFSYPPAERDHIRESWHTLMRWSKALKTRKDLAGPIDTTRKIVVFGGGSFGTAVGCVLAKQKADMDVVLLVRDPHLCKDINERHCNTRYLKDFPLPPNVRATTKAAEAIHGAQFAVHAVPVQSSRAFLVAIRDLLPPLVPIVCLSKGLEVGTGLMMSELIPSALERKQPAVFLSGPSFAREVMENRPTGLVAASKDKKLNRVVQALFANQTMRVNTTSDVVGVEICGALKNVLAIAAGIVEGLDLGHNALAALISQGCSEIRWLSEKMGGKPTTMSGLSGLGDIMLTCYGNLSRNRSVGIRLGQGERLEDILASSPQVAEGVATAGVVVSLARKYKVSLPVLTAVAQVLDNAITPSEAVSSIMNLPQIEER